MDNNKPKDLGAGWIKSGNYGDYVSISLEIEGKKYNFTMFPNKYKKEGSKQPDYRIPAPKQEQLNGTTSKYEAQLASVMAQKEANEKKSAQLSAIAKLNIQPDITELDIPF